MSQDVTLTYEELFERAGVEFDPETQACWVLIHPSPERPGSFTVKATIDGVPHRFYLTLPPVRATLVKRVGGTPKDRGRR